MMQHRPIDAYAPHFQPPDTPQYVVPLLSAPRLVAPLGRPHCHRSAPPHAWSRRAAPHPSGLLVAGSLPPPSSSPPTTSSHQATSVSPVLPPMHVSMCHHVCSSSPARHHPPLRRRSPLSSNVVGSCCHAIASASTHARTRPRQRSSYLTQLPRSEATMSLTSCSSRGLWSPLDTGAGKQPTS
jgi:hypothetical protein